LVGPVRVLESRCEIGVLHAIGATNCFLTRLVIAEGMIMGLISWLIAALPISKVLLVAASLLSARSATRLTIREVLAYE
jgi:putative ABC transport system permease protein